MRGQKNNGRELRNGKEGKTRLSVAHDRSGISRTFYGLSGGFPWTLYRRRLTVHLDVSKVFFSSFARRSGEVYAVYV